MVPYLRAANVKDGSLDLADVKEMNFEPSEQAAFALRRGDVLVTEGSGSLRAVGASAVWTGEIAGTVCFQNTLLRLRPRASTDPRFLAWWCRYAFADGLFASVATGANIYHVSAERVRALPVRYLALGHQRAIADFLDVETARIDALIAKKRRLIELLDERLDAELAATFRELGSGSVALGRFVRSIGQGISPQASTRAALDTEWGVLKLSAVKLGRFIPQENKCLDPDTAVDPALRPAVGDLLVTRSNTPQYVGDACAVREPPPQVVLCDLIYQLKLDSRLLSTYAALALISPGGREQLSSSARGASQSMVKLRGEDVKAVRIPHVDVESQQAVVTVAEAAADMVQVLTAALTRQINLLAEHRQALITAAVTGELAVPGVPG